MTPWKHATSTVQKYGGKEDDYIRIHDWFDETKQFTGNWTHRALRHHAAGIQWAVDKFGHAVLNSDGRAVPVKSIAEQHVIEDCGYIPAVADWLESLVESPERWMLKVGKKARDIEQA